MNEESRPQLSHELRGHVTRAHASVIHHWLVDARRILLPEMSMKDTETVDALLKIAIGMVDSLQKEGLPMN